MIFRCAVCDGDPTGGVHVTVSPQDPWIYQFEAMLCPVCAREVCRPIVKYVCRLKSGEEVAEAVIKRKAGA